MTAPHPVAPPVQAVHRLPRGRIVVDRAEHVYPDLPDGSVDLVISDGPYGMRIAEWDRLSLDDLPDWYAPHVAAWGDVCAPSASIYLWNTPAGLMRIDPVVRAAGWTLRAVITWDKGIETRYGRTDAKTIRTWADVVEVCALYQRDAVDERAQVDLWNTYGPTHPVRLYLDNARAAAGLSLQDVDRALSTRDMARHWFTWSQWCLPSRARYADLQRILPTLTRSYDDLAAERDRVWADCRAAIDAPGARAYFDGVYTFDVGNVWRHGALNPRTSARAGSDDPRLLGADGKALHACQKPLAFYERMIRASCPPATAGRPAGLVLEPFGGTCRTAVWCELAPVEHARRYVCVEPDADGRGYVDGVLASLA